MLGEPLNVPDRAPAAGSVMATTGAVLFVLTIERSACWLIVVKSRSLLLAAFVSVTPAGVVTVAVLVSVPLTSICSINDWYSSSEPVHQCTASGRVCAATVSTQDCSAAN